MNKKVLGAAVAAAMVMPGMAAANSQADLEESLRLLEAQVSALKAQMAEMKEVQESSSGGHDNFTWGGVAEYEYQKGGVGSAAKLELEAAIQASEEVSASVLLKAEAADKGSTLTVDAMSVTYDAGIAQITATSDGHPFGDWSSNMISTSLTKSVGDTDGATKLQIDVPVGENLTLTAAVDDDISSYVASGEIAGLGITAGHISDMSTTAGDAANHIAATYSLGDFTLFGEKVAGKGDYDAHNVELAYAFTVAGKDAGIAVGGQKRTDAGNDEKRTMAAGTINVAENLDVTVEYLDSDINANDAWLGQLAYGF